MGDHLRYRITDRLIEVHLEGDYSAARLIEVIDDALAHATSERMFMLIDARQSTANRPSSEVRVIAGELSRRAPKIERLAIVTGSEDHYGLSRMGAARAEDSGLVAHPFRTLQEALDFLRIAGP